MIFSIHIPKTAGTTIGAYLAKAFPRSIFYDYDYLVVKKEQEFIKKHKPLLERFEIIHGHFAYKKYADIFEDAKYITCVRNPVDRIISNYFHVIREKNPNYPVYQNIVKYNMDIVDFAQLPQMSKAQYFYLDGRGIYRYDFIAITEKMNESIPMLSRFLKKPAILDEFQADQCKPKMINTNSQKREISKDIRKKIEEACPWDLELYRQALEKFAAMKKWLL